MAEKVEKIAKLRIPAGKATPAPPVNPALGQADISITGSTREFNARTADQAGPVIPVVISIYGNRSFTFVTKTSPAAVLSEKVVKIEKGSGEPNENRVAKASNDRVKEIVELETEDLSAANVGAAVRMVEGTARDMGITVE